MNQKIQNTDFIELTKEAFEHNQTVSFKVKGVSMWPFYKDQKTTVTLQKKDQYRLRDVVLASYKDRYVLHRIIKLKGNNYILRGDGAYAKEVITKVNIIGAVITHEYKREIKESNKLYRFKVILWIFNPFRKIIIRLFRR